MKPLCAVTLLPRASVCQQHCSIHTDFWVNNIPTALQHDLNTDGACIYPALVKKVSAASSCIRPATRPHSSLPRPQDPNRRTSSWQELRLSIRWYLGTFKGVVPFFAIKNQRTKTGHPDILNNAFSSVWRHNFRCLNRPLETALVKVLHTQ